MSATAHFRPTFTDLRAEIERRVAQGEPEDSIAQLVDQFLAAGGGLPAPVIEYDGTVTWIYRDSAAHHVAVVGDILGYDPTQTHMTNLARCDVFYLTVQLPLDTQIAYAFCVDQPSPPDAADIEPWLAHCRPDPLNPYQVLATHPLRLMSVLTMPGAGEPDTMLHRSSIPSPAVALGVIPGSHTGRLHRVWVHTPAELHSAISRYPVCYFLDGESYLLAGHMPHILDTLVAEGEIVPCVAVFVETPSALSIDAVDAVQIEQTLIHDIVPWIDTHYPTSTDPRDRVICGAHRYASVALHTALVAADTFGGVIAQSPALDILTTEIARQIAALLTENVNLPRSYLDVGRYESIAAHQYVHSLCNALMTGGAELSYQEFPGDGGFLGWRSTAVDALRTHFGTATMPEL
ncbi:MAG TPA: alpha/beta hydrolase-fold protein [Roseiflexaceae bacterium]|nr:alpha/beta hydrolase-fold protein [Roseiflexaceae bacterium]